MTDKSHVSLEQHQCIVCGCKYDTGTILFDRRLQNSLEQTTLTGSGLCPDHQKLFDDGYIALVEVDPTKSSPAGGPNASHMKHEDAHRTGVIMHMRRPVAEAFFTVPMTGPMVFADPDLIAHFQAMMEQAT
jgi:hypothetical protein